jgi:hypothetical protein
MNTNWTTLLDEAVTRPGLLLEAYTAFHSYSIGNQILAIVQCKERGLPTGPLSTFPGWKAKGRYVKKGEKALMLCMPLVGKTKDETGEAAPYVHFAFKPRWFVLAQTEGEEYAPPDIPEWDKARALLSLNITETPFELLTGSVQGYARKRSISVSPIASVPHKTTFHELAHVCLGHTTEADFNDGEATPRNLQEVEAECVALICCETLGLDGAEYARGYIQHWRATGEPIPEHSAQRIFRAADLILKAGAPPERREEN